jgi:hypothetical protein
LKLYFRDNFFNSGQTDILNESNERIGEVELHSAFGSTLDVYDQSGQRKYGGKFPIFSHKWSVIDPSGAECGLLRYRLSFLSKKYEYEAYGRGVFEITSPAFSREYEIRDEKGALTASFEKIDGWFAASAYCLDNQAANMDSYEWIAFVLGMNEIQKRQRQQH